MSLDAINNRLSVLIQNGEHLLGSAFRNEWSTELSVDSILFYKWQSGCLSFISKVFSESSPQFKLYSENCKRDVENQTKKGQAVLLSIQEELEVGFLKSIEDLVSADIFNDFIEMSSYLLKEGYKDPAASLMGAVLEDGLRRIYKNNDSDYKKPKDISSAAQILLSKKIISSLEMKQIKVWEEIRNHADHSEFDLYKKENVQGMIEGVSTFLVKYL